MIQRSVEGETEANSGRLALDSLKTVKGCDLERGNSNLLLVVVIVLLCFYLLSFNQTGNGAFSQGDDLEEERAERQWGGEKKQARKGDRMERIM